MKLAHVLASMTALAFAESVLACSCIPPRSFFFEHSPKAGAEVWQRADAIVHARVVELVGSDAARIVVLERFKGPVDLAEIHLEPTSQPCGTSVAIGEERVFAIFDGKVGQCSKWDAEPWLLEHLRRGK